MTAFNQQDGQQLTPESLARRVNALEALGPFDYLGAFAWASLPAAASYAGYRARVTDGGPAGGVYVVSDGARWKPVNGTANLATLGAAVSGIANVETIVLQSLLPAGMWQAGDILRARISLTKSGATDTGLVSVHVGTAGTTGDTAIAGLSSFIAFPAAGVSGGFEFEVRLVSATSAQRLGGTGSNLTAYGGSSSVAASAATTITSAAANALYVTLGLASGGATNTLGIQSGSIQLITP